MHLKHIEDIIKQNDNKFDGIINNTSETPTVDALEAKVKAGKPKGEKQSIRARLKSTRAKKKPPRKKRRPKRKITIWRHENEHKIYR